MTIPPGPSIDTADLIGSLKKVITLSVELHLRGVADLRTLAHLMPESGTMFGPKPTSIDAAIYGFIANIYFYEIDTPLKACVTSHPNLVRHCIELHTAVSC
jgi:hypothetical protein